MNDKDHKPDDSDISTFGVCLILFIVGLFLLLIGVSLLSMFGVMIW